MSDEPTTESMIRRNTGAILGDHLAVVYTIASDRDGPTKIGMTRNLQTRLLGLQTGSWSPLTIYGWRAAIPDGSGAKYKSMMGAMAAGARALENEAHKVLCEMGLQLCGEWFDISVSDARLVLDKCGERRGVKAVSLDQIAGAHVDGGLDPQTLRAQRALIASMGAAASYVANHQPYPIDMGA